VSSVILGIAVVKCWLGGLNQSNQPNQFGHLSPSLAMRLLTHRDQYDVTDSSQVYTHLNTERLFFAKQMELAEA
jgi:hypothetical protein